jgi:lon-related putative ATP-dependent protease
VTFALFAVKKYLETSMYKKCEVPVKLLRKEVDLSKLKFKTTEDITPLVTVIGQDRAVRAIDFGLAIEDPSYNIFVTGFRGTGRTTIVRDLLDKIAASRTKPEDWLFVYNFENPDEPKAISLPSKKAKSLITKFDRLINKIKSSLKTAFESEEYVERKNEILEQGQQKKRDKFGKIEGEAKKVNIQIKGSSAGFQTIPMLDDKPMDDQHFQNLTKKEQKSIESNIKLIQKMIQDMVVEATTIDRVAEEEVEDLNQETANFIIGTLFVDLINEFEKFPQIIEYFKAVLEDIIQNVYTFMDDKPVEQEPGKPPEMMDGKRVDKYKVNRVVDNSHLKGAPVIYEMNPTYNNLFGRIEKKSYMGYLYTDYTMIKAGSLLKANGGYLILDAEQVLRNSFVYDALKRALRNRYLVIEDINELYGVMTSAGLKPSPIKLDVKVVMIGRSNVYHILHSHDEDFRKIFKVRADFDYEVKESPSSVQKYIRFISRVVREEGLRHFDKNGVKTVIEHAFKLVDHQHKLSIRFSEIVRLIRESSYWAKHRRHKFVQKEDVQHAIAEETYRRNLPEEKIQNAIREKTYKFDVDSAKVGQINGLAVYNLGDYSFGKPTRITVSTYIGNRGIINIEREAKLSGKIHDKGVLIFSGFFASRLGGSMPLSFSASITFEQSYGMIDGDSASCAELYALLSSLSGIPIYQGIAVTGSINQKGEVQAIGGVNEKIEGFFEVCKIHKLTGKQGVLIPESNVKNLMLNDEVIKAVKQKKFNIWAVSKIEDGIRLLTGVPAGQMHKDGSFTKDSIFAKVQEQITEFSRKSRRFGKSLDKDIQKDLKDDKEDEENGE